MLNIKPTDSVLEIGSGNRPRRRSNILCDRFIEDNSERASEESIVIDERPFVVADGQYLPFKDKSFDYVIASHVLEHVENPQKFISELMRVASRGFIETPSELGEELFGWPFHRWRVRIEKDTIAMRRRTEDSRFGGFFHNMYDRDLLFAEFVDSHYEEFYVQYEWEGSIKLRIEDNADRTVKPNSSVCIIDTRSKARNFKIRLARASLFPILKLLRHFRKFD
jgi:SAM-dependent methyltransferase